MYSAFVAWGADTLNSRRATSSLVRLVVGEERWEASYPLGYSPSKLEWNRAKSYCHLYGAKRLRPMIGVHPEVQPVSYSGNFPSFPLGRTRQQ
ncbi:hypothetical protein TNCV_4621411 [Trichonephila clavipes]|nr:hypothetical protein TNCV_4621411 [Trichonephila clavipes]